MKKYIIIIPILLLLLTACTNEIPFNEKDTESKMVVNALINTDCLENRIFISLTGKYDIETIKDVSVNLYVNGVLKEMPESIADSSSYPKVKSFLVKSTFKPGDKVKIEASTKDGKYHAWGEETVPDRPSIIKIDTASVRMKNKYDSYSHFLRFKVTFKDIPDKDSYYRIIVENKKTCVFLVQGLTEREETVNSYDYSFVSREDVVLTDGRPTTVDDEENGISTTSYSNTYGVFDDSRFLNSEYTMTVSQDKTSSSYYYYENIKRESISVTIYLQCISKAEYYYLQALNRSIDNSDDDILSEPVHLPTNINGGIGILGFSTESSRTIQTFNWNAQ